MFDATIRSKLCMGLTVYDRRTMKFKKLNALQNKSLRRILGMAPTVLQSANQSADVPGNRPDLSL